MVREVEGRSRIAGSLLSRSLNYYLIPGRLISDDARLQEIHEKAFAFWVEFWTGVFQHNGTNSTPNPDDFFRQDLIGIFEHRGQIVALHSHTFFDLTPRALNHSYFAKHYSPKAIAQLKEHRSRHLMTMEYYSIRPGWSAKDLGISLAAVMGGLAIEIARAAGSDTLVAITRADVGINNISRKWGGTSLDKGLVVHNTPVELVAIFLNQAKAHPHPRVQELVQRFWQNRIENQGGTYAVHRKTSAGGI